MYVVHFSTTYNSYESMSELSQIGSAESAISTSSISCTFIVKDGHSNTSSTIHCVLTRTYLIVIEQSTLVHPQHNLHANGLVAT